MADNYAITAGSGTTKAADDVGGVLYPRFKLSLGADGSAVDAVAGAGAVSTGVQRVTLCSDDVLVADIEGVIKAEDAAHSSGDKGIQALTVRKDTAAATSGTDGDYQPLITDANGRLHVVLSSGVYAEDAAHTSGDGVVPAGVVRKDTAAQTAGTDGDYSVLVNDANGRLHATLSDVTFAEDAAHTTGDKGIQILSKRTDTAASSAGTDGDYATINTDANGRLHVIEPSCTTIASAIFAEDAAHSSTDKGVQILCKRTDAPAVSSGTDGDYSTTNVDANGKLWVTDPHTVLSVTPVIDTTQYAAGDAVGGKQTLTGAVLVTSGVSILESLVVIDKANQKPVLDIFFFDADPSAATITNNAAFVFSTDVAKVIGRAQVAAADYVTTNSIAVAKIALSERGLTLKANGGTAIYAAVVLNTGTPTFAVGDLIFKYGLAQK